MERTSFRNSPPSPPRPPPPPPPLLPPLPPRQSSNTNDNDDETNPPPPPTLVQTEKIIIASTLSIRSVDGSIVRIKTTPSMTQTDLAHCIMHAALAPSRERDLIDSWGMDDSSSESSWEHIAGLFRERDGLFVPLTMILQDVEEYEVDTFRISRAAEIDLSQEMEQYRFDPLRLRLLAFCGVVFLGICYRPSFELKHIVEYANSFVEYVYTTFAHLPTILLENYVNLPLNELYR